MMQDGDDEELVMQYFPSNSIDTDQLPVVYQQRSYEKPNKQPMQVEDISGFEVEEVTGTNNFVAPAQQEVPSASRINFAGGSAFTALENGS